MLGLESDLMELIDCLPYHKSVAGRKELDGLLIGIVQGLAYVLHESIVKYRGPW